MNQGGRAFSNLVGTQRVFIGTNDSGDQGAISANSPGVDVTIKSDTSASDTGLFFDLTQALNVGGGTKTGSCTSGTDGMYLSTDADADAGLYVCENGTWVKK